MAINISVSRLNRLHEASKDGLILLILTRVEAKDGVAVPTIVNSVSELHDKFEVRTSVESGEPVLVGLYQMYTAEYLLSTGATLLVYPTAGAGAFTGDPSINKTYYVENPPVPEPSTTYLTFRSNSSFSLKVNDSTKHWNGTLYYSTDLETWHEWDGTTILNSVDNKLYLRGKGNTVITGNNQNYKWVLEGSNIGCTGNIENLLDWEAVESGNHPSMASYCYAYLFYDCANLTSPPALPATTLADYCYAGMFSGCTALASAPALPATTLAYYCYNGMFRGCESLKVSSDPTETYRYEWRIPASGTGTEAIGWNYSMLSGTGGAFNINTDGPNLLDIEELDYKLILAPYTFIGDPGTNIAQLAKLVQSTDSTGSTTGCLNLSAQLFLDLKLDGIFEPNKHAQLTAATRTLLNQVRTTPKIEVYANGGPASFYSRVTGLPTFGTNGFIGVPASAIAAARKAKLLRDKMPFIPVAGKDNGTVTEITTLYKKLSTFEKEELQANNINVLTTKLGLGPLFVSQNTMVPGTDPREPLRRSHAVTLALWFKREVVKAAYEFEHTPNNTKSWALLELKLRKLFDNIYEAGGLEERAEILLGRTTTSANDIKEGKLNIIINFIPVNILREININLNVIGETNTIEAVVGGGI